MTWKPKFRGGQLHVDVSKEKFALVAQVIQTLTAIAEEDGHETVWDYLREHNPPDLKVFKDAGAAITKQGRWVNILWSVEKGNSKHTAGLALERPKGKRTHKRANFSVVSWFDDGREDEE